MKILMRFNLLFLLLGIITTLNPSYAQEAKLGLTAYDGAIVAGYAERGGFINFTGPNINLTLDNSKFILGMLPSLRFREDRSPTTQNSFITPSLGVGLTYTYRWLAVQIPFYYRPKTVTADGIWDIGVGLGIRLNRLKK